MSTSTVYEQDEVRSATGRRWEQIGALGGIAFVILQLASQALIQVGGMEPAFDAQAAEIVDFFMNRDPGLARAGAFLSVLSAIALLWFLGALWAALRRHEGEPAWLSLVAFGAGLAGTATLLGAGGGGWELALLRLEEGLSPETARLLFDQGNLNFATFGVTLAGMLLAASAVTLRDGGLPRWLGWLGLAVAVGLLAVRAAWATDAGVKFLPYVLFWVWLIAASVALVRRARRGGG